MNLSFLKSPYILIFSIIFGLACGYADIPFIHQISDVFSNIFMRLLKFISLPVIFFSLMSTIVGMGNYGRVRVIGGRILKYTILTTIISAGVALVLYIVLNPLTVKIACDPSEIPKQTGGYINQLINIIPCNIVQPFAENNVISVLIIALLFSFSILTLPNDKREPLQNIIESLFASIMTMIRWIITLMPVAVWAFMVIFIKEIRTGFDISNIGTYILVVLGANLFQGLIVLPLFLKFKGIPPFQALKTMFPAITLAFFSKSSVAAMPLAMECVEKQGVKKNVSRFSFPLCTTINMNACAAFIIVTVLFVAESNGMTFTMFDKVLWVFVATIAAIGNAGVPMGCFFLASALLTTMGVPLVLMGVILPFYALLDMLETAVNIWSDGCVTMVVDKETD